MTKKEQEAQKLIEESKKEEGKFLQFVEAVIILYFEKPVDVSLAVSESSRDFIQLEFFLKEII